MEYRGQPFPSLHRRDIILRLPKDFHPGTDASYLRRPDEDQGNGYLGDLRDDSSAGEAVQLASESVPLDFHVDETQMRLSPHDP